MLSQLIDRLRNSAPFYRKQLLTISDVNLCFKCLQTKEEENQIELDSFRIEIGTGKSLESPGRDG